MYRGKKTRVFKTIGIVIIIVFALALLLMMYIDEKHTQIELAQREKEWREEVKEREREYTIDVRTNALVNNDDGGINSYSVVNGSAQGEIILSPEDFVEFSSQAGLYREAFVSKSLDVSVDKTDILICEFQAYTLEGNAELQISIGSKKERVFINSDKQTFFITVSNLTKLDRVMFMIVGEYKKTVIDSVSLINYRQYYDIHELKTGAFYDEPFEEIVIDANDPIIPSSTQMLKNGNYLFAISIDKGTLTAYQEQSDGSVNELAVIQGMGTIRDMAFSKSKDAIIVTARQNGVYVVDISDPGNMSIRSHYDTLEYATGLCVRDDFAFICSRYFGIEIVDISNLDNPTFVNCIASNGCEYQDCFVDGNVLYVGVYYNKRVDVFDVSDACNPKKLSTIDLNGSGQGLFVENGVLYAATALDAPSSEGKLWNYGKGTGNGLEIYDVTDPQKPHQLSVVKTDGRLSINARDVWDVVVSNGYAFLSNMFGGVYVFDVSVPSEPQRVATYNVVAKKETELFSVQDLSGYLFPYDVEQETRGCAYHVILDDGYFYFVASNFGIYHVDCEYSKPEGEKAQSTVAIGNITPKIPESKKYQIQHYSNSSCIWAIASSNDYYYVANGESGIVVLDKQLSEIQRYKTVASARDVIIWDSIMYVAESESGVGIYDISNPLSIAQIGRYEVNPQKECITQLQMSSDKRYILALASISSYKVIDISTPATPIDAETEIEKEIGLMYYRTICSGLVSEKYIGLAGSNYQCWYESVNGEMQLINRIPNSLYNKSNGFAAVNDKCLAIYNNGYVYFDPSVGELSKRIKIEGVTFEGKCSSNGRILVISTSYSGKIQIVNISNLEAPALMAELSINGNPDIAVFDNEDILIPCRYYGLLKLTPNN